MLKVSEELLNDSVFDLESYIAKSSADAWVLKKRKPSSSVTVWQTCRRFPNYGRR